MTLHVFDADFVYRGRIENWISLEWTEQYKDKGGFSLEVYDTDKYAGLLRRGWYLYRADRPGAMMIVSVKRDTESNTITAAAEAHTTMTLPGHPAAAAAATRCRFAGSSSSRPRLPA